MVLAKLHMKIDKIISLANQKVRLRFLAMERSLRATGCQLPILVIPYDNNLFDLPEGSKWWEMPEITGWLKVEQAHPMMRKYQCLTIGKYQYVDADICFLRNPENVLEPHSGFITSCAHWRNPEHTYTEESKHIMSQKSTTWQKNVFNAGQFACDRPLFNIEEIKAVAMRPNFVKTCMRFPHLPTKQHLTFLCLSLGSRLQTLHYLPSIWNQLGRATILLIMNLTGQIRNANPT